MSLPSGSGSPTARIMLIGDAYGSEEERRGEPFVGTSGQELNRMLQEAGILRSDCYVTNVVNSRPPQNDIEQWIPVKKKDVKSNYVFVRGKMVHPIVKEGLEQLEQEINLVGPELIITFGNTPLWALTGADGVMKWRGSLLQYNGTHLVPTIHPTAVLRQWEFRSQAVHDLRRAARQLTAPVKKPEWNFIVRPSYNRAVEAIQNLFTLADKGELWLDLDIETRHNHIACIGISWTKLDALVIPLMCLENRYGYWSEEEEAQLVFLLYKLFTHPNVKTRYQNGLFDMQYLHRYWHFIANHGQDTMLSQHSLFAGQKKSLAYQASLYCEHYVYWKDDGKTWDKNVGEDQLWRYNAEDCIRTREVGEVEREALEATGLADVDTWQQRLFRPVLRAMIRGVRVDQDARNRLANEIQQELTKREQYFRDILGHDLNPRSPAQMVRLFYEDLKQKPNMTRAKKGVPGHLTCDDAALQTIGKREPLLQPLLQAIAEYRSLGVFLSTFILMPLDIDGRMRCSYNITGTETYRLSSSENVFGSGGNLQNLPKGDEKGLLPNIRKLYIPDPGMTFFDTDLDRADLQVVAWEADQPELKYALRKGVDMHLMNAFAIAGKEPPDLDWLVEGHPEYARIRSNMGKSRQLAKMWCHGTNYGGSARTMAINCGISIAESERAQQLYFGRYPGIKKWHMRVEEQLRRTKTVTNKFGYRRVYFERTDNILPEALAWIPQSTVGIYIDRVWIHIEEQLPEVQVLLQVHDSLAGQFPTLTASKHKHDILNLAKQVVVPYDDPLVIPLGIKTSDISWGDVE